MSGFNMNDYVDVAERIEQFYERFPEGSLKSGSPPRIVEVGTGLFVMYHARAYRFPGDECPADGWAWEPVPGPTQFTKDSELMNAETAAWGRAIVAAGFKTKKIASADEVRNRAGGTDGAPGQRPAGRAAESEPATPAFTPPDSVTNRAEPQDGGDPAKVVIHFSKNAGKELGELTPNQLKWYAETWEPREGGDAQDRRLKTAATMLHKGMPGGVAPIDDIPFAASTV